MTETLQQSFSAGVARLGLRNGIHAEGKLIQIAFGFSAAKGDFAQNKPEMAAWPSRWLLGLVSGGGS